MRARIHRGATEVGGSCVELEAQGKLLLLDAGLPLDEGAAASARLPRSAERGDPNLLAVVVSHSHPDHYGLLKRLAKTVPVLMGEAGSAILQASAFYTRQEPPSVAGFLVDGETIELGPFRITPFLVDHSAFDSYSLLVEADGRKLFYTGDLRAHGRKTGTFARLTERPPANIDVLLMEGTRVGRASRADGPESERDLEERCVEAFRSTEGLALACFSAQNIDRLVTVHRAALRSGRNLVIDPYAADVAAATGRETIPQADWDEVRVYAPNTQRIRVKESGEYGRIDRYRGSRIYREQLAAEPGRWVMLFRPSMGRELKQAGCLRGARALWMMWPGYLDRPGDRARDTFDQLGVPLEVSHSSGHARVEDLQRLAAAIAANRIVPIHTDSPESFETLFDRVERQPDGEWWEV